MRFLLTCTVILFSWQLHAQDIPVDSLQSALRKAKNDTSRVLVLARLVQALGYFHTDSSLQYARTAFEAADASGFKYGRYKVLISLTYSYVFAGDYSKALASATAALRLAEQLPDRKEESIANAHMPISFIYRIMGQYRNAITHMALCVEHQQSSGKPLYLVRNAFTNAALTYLGLHMADSAFWYAEKGRGLETESGKREPLNFATYGLVRERLGKIGEAEKFYRQALDIYFANPQYDNAYYLMRVYLSIAGFYNRHQRRDSAIHYARLAVTDSEKKKFLHYQLEAARLLSDMYESGHLPDSAMKYTRMALTLHDSIFNQDRIRQFEDIAFTEKQRQEELRAANERYKSQVRQYALAATLLIFLLLASILYRSNLRKQRDNELLNRQKKEIEAAMARLRATQNQLVHSEKMASLGELTAGIAHEIQNPMNFINNFSELNAELMDEMESAFRNGDNDQAFTIASDIRKNLEKINHHGKRADEIVKSMLQHSRLSTGQKEWTDINALADEYFRLSYHGIRARDKDFRADLRTAMDPAAGRVLIVPQDIGRVLLNLFNNAFYSINEKKKKYGHSFEPQVQLSTRRTNHGIEIRVRDNGMGIPQKIREKVFQPFFTTKPTGQGTGLGLSLSYDIVVKEHAGSFSLDSAEGEYAEFIIQLPFAGNG